MRNGYLPESRSSRCAAASRAISLIAAVAMVAAILGASSGAALAAAHRQPRPGAHSGLTLAQAPASLRAAVRRVLGRAPAPSGGGFQQSELTDPGGAGGDHFGLSVAISGSTAVIGAYGTNSQTGAAYVFVHSGTTWSQQAVLTAADGASGDHFGSSVAIAGSTVVVGAPGKSFGTGAAYVFTRSGTAWSQQALLTAADAAQQDAFGVSVAIFRSTAVVGADGHNVGTWAAYVYVRSGTAWSQQAELTAVGGARFDALGSAVAISRGTVLAGAPGRNGQAGAAYVFVRSAGTTWSQLPVLTASDASFGSFFGDAVAVSGSTLAVGANGGNSSTGAAYVFVRSGTAWSQQAKLTAATVASNGGFGDAVALSGSTVAVGAEGTNQAPGDVFVFVRSGTSWSQETELTALDGTSGDHFGIGVAISGTTMVTGADGKNSDTGVAYAFPLPAPQAELTAPGGAAGDQFGYSVAIAGSTAVVGAPSGNSGTGAAYVFLRSGTTWSQQTELTASGGAAGDQFGSSVAITGSTAVVGAPSGNSGTGAAYVFLRSGTAWSQQAELTASDGRFGDQFGHSVAISGFTAFVGAPAANSNDGEAYPFVRSGAAWYQMTALTDSNGTGFDGFGASVAIVGSTAVVGAPNDNFATGAAYVFVRSDANWVQQAELTAADGAADDAFGASVAITGTTVVVGAPDKTFPNTGAVYLFVQSGTAWPQLAELTEPGAASGDRFGFSVAISGSTLVAGAYGKNSSTGAAYAF